MPRKTKEQKELEKEESPVTKATKKTTKKATKKDVSEPEKAAKTSKKAKAENKELVKEDVKPVAAKASKKNTSKSTTKASTADKTQKKTSASKSTTKKASTKSTTKKTSAKSASKKSVTKSAKKKIDVVEYYDLPYRYNQTVVKLLAQTPSTLFVYWDISDEDRENYKKQYGYDFFEKTRPILIVHNDTMHYDFEVEINDFANSWYLHVNDSDCAYRIELGRKPVWNYVPYNIPEEILNDENSEVNRYPSKPIDWEYFYVTMSNTLESPNDKILLDRYTTFPPTIQIRNVKTNNQYSKQVSIQSLKQIGNIYDLYKKLYNEENIEDIYNLNNPSSGNPSSNSLSSKFK